MGRWISSSEIRLALRLIAKQPILSLTIVVALATGIAMATIGFTLREAVLFSSLPFANGDRFVRLVMHSDADDNVELDLDAFHAVRDSSTAFAHVGAYGGAELALENADGTIQPVTAALMTPGSFQFLPAVPMMGRVLIEADGKPGAEPVAVVRESLWRRRFGADPSIVGQVMPLAGVRRTIVGVIADAFQFPSSGEIWVPLDEATLAGRAGSLTVFGILRDGLDITGATAELVSYSRPARQGRPGTATSLRALPFTGDDETTNFVMSGLVAVLVLVLLVVASNIASLVLARTWARSSELAVRTAIGAGRARLVGQLFTEVAMLCAVAAVAGIGLAYVALDYLVGLMTGVPYWMTFEPTLKTMGFVVALTFLISIASGMMPALRVTRADLTSTLHAGGRGLAAGGFGSAGRVLLVEVALAVALLNGAIVVARAFTSYLDDIPALPKGQVLTARMSGPQSAETRDQLLAAIRTLPGVVSAGAASHLPRDFDPLGSPIEIEALDGHPSAITGSVPAVAVSDGFLETVGGRASIGRPFSANDFREGAAPVVIVSRPFVDRYFGGRSPVGRRIKRTVPDSADAGAWREIIGVVPDLGMRPGDPAHAPAVYVPLPPLTSSLSLAIRSNGNPSTLAGPLRKAVTEIDPSIDLRSIRPLEDVGREQRSFLSGMASAMLALGGAALLLSVVSIYALLSFMVTRRTREVGIRVALGAERWQILATVAGRAFAYVGAGAVLGTIVGVEIAGFQSVMLIQMPEIGVLTPSVVIGMLAASSLAAAWLPTRRALSIRPATALNSD